MWCPFVKQQHNAHMNSIMDNMFYENINNYIQFTVHDAALTKKRNSLFLCFFEWEQSKETHPNNFTNWNYQKPKNKCNE